MDSVMRRPRVLASRSAFTRLTELVVICARGTASQHVCLPRLAAQRKCKARAAATSIFITDRLNPAGPAHSAARSALNHAR